MRKAFSLLHHVANVFSLFLSGSFGNGALEVLGTWPCVSVRCQLQEGRALPCRPVFQLREVVSLLVCIAAVGGGLQFSVAGSDVVHPDPTTGSAGTRGALHMRALRCPPSLAGFYSGYWWLT